MDDDFDLMFEVNGRLEFFRVFGDRMFRTLHQADDDVLAEIGLVRISIFTPPLRLVA